MENKTLIEKLVSLRDFVKFFIGELERLDMHFETDRTYMIFKNENYGRINYRLNMSKFDDREQQYVYGSIPCRFRKDVKVYNKQKIKLKDSWLDFYTKDKKTYCYIFINDFELVNDNEQDNKQVETGQVDLNNDFMNDSYPINDDDLPF